MDHSDNPTATHPCSCETTSSASYELRTNEASCSSGPTMIHLNTLHRVTQTSPLTIMFLCVLWSLWLNSPACPDLPCLSTEGPTRKIKVLFAFSRAGSCSEAECQAARSGTAAWRCAENMDTVYRVWFAFFFFNNTALPLHLLSQLHIKLFLKLVVPRRGNKDGTKVSGCVFQ